MGTKDICFEYSKDTLWGRGSNVADLTYKIEEHELFELVQVGIFVTQTSLVDYWKEFELSLRRVSVNLIFSNFVVEIGRYSVLFFPINLASFLLHFA